MEFPGEKASTDSKLVNLCPASLAIRDIRPKPVRCRGVLLGDKCLFPSRRLLQAGQAPLHIHSLSCCPLSSPRRWSDLPGWQLRLSFFSWVGLTSTGPRVQGVWSASLPLCLNHTSQQPGQPWLHPSACSSETNHALPGSHLHPTSPLVTVMLVTHVPNTPSYFSSGSVLGQVESSYQLSSPQTYPSTGKNEKEKPEN